MLLTSRGLGCMSDVVSACENQPFGFMLRPKRAPAEPIHVLVWSLHVPSTVRLFAVYAVHADVIGALERYVSQRLFSSRRLRMVASFASRTLVSLDRYQLVQTPVYICSGKSVYVALREKMTGRSRSVEYFGGGEPWAPPQPPGV